METERLTLRRFTAEDVDALEALDGDPEVMRYLSGGAATPREMIAGVVLPHFLASYATDEPFGVWAVEERAGGAFVGWVSLKPDVTRPGEATLGYRLRREFWGRGYATEAAHALLAGAFARDASLERVTATTYQDNAASRRVMEKLGMTLARSFRYEPASVPANHATHAEEGAAWDGDDVEYALERKVWERRQARP